jgi:hypothetical protein
LYGEGEQDPRADSHRAHGERNNELIREALIKTHTHIARPKKRKKKKDVALNSQNHGLLPALL